MRSMKRDGVPQNWLGIPADCSFRDFITVFGDQWHLNSQLYWLENARGKIAMDFIGKFERLQEDFAHIGEALGIEEAELPTELMFGGAHYTEVYDDETKDIVARRYAKEIDMFGFTFGE
jgi:hypothetical protein